MDNVLLLLMGEMRNVARQHVHSLHALFTIFNFVLLILLKWQNAFKYIHR
jgi:hypothetical protein